MPFGAVAVCRGTKRAKPRSGARSSSARGSVATRGADYSTQHHSNQKSNQIKCRESPVRKFHCAEGWGQGARMCQPRCLYLILAYFSVFPAPVSPIVAVLASNHRDMSQDSGKHGCLPGRILILRGGLGASNASFHKREWSQKDKTADVDILSPEDYLGTAEKSVAEKKRKKEKIMDDESFADGDAGNGESEVKPAEPPDAYCTNDSPEAMRRATFRVVRSRSHARFPSHHASLAGAR